MLSLQDIHSPEHEFGQAFATARLQASDVTKAFVQGRSTRRQIWNLEKSKGKSNPPRSPKKAI
jgi:hypothetical protein